ncbi:MAG: DUF421 domain-containing protein [Motilibacteraceae bacterium]
MSAQSWLAGVGPGLGVVAGKAALIYVAALLGLRVAHRRTLSQWTAIDFAAAVAVGAVIGRTALAPRQSFLVGVVALLTILATHAAATFVRYHPLVGKAVDHRVRVLVDHGRLRHRQLVITGLTENDVLSKLRQLGHEDLSQLRYVLYETKGELTVVPERGAGVPDPPLVQRGLRDAAGYEGEASS